MVLSLHHVSDRLAALDSVYRALEEGGVLLVVEPRRDRLFGHGSTPGEVSASLSKAGFRVVRTKTGLFGFHVLAQKGER